MKRKYFRRLFFAFLFAAVCPICICVLAISVGNYRMTKEKYRRRAEELAVVCSYNTEELLCEYNEVLSSLCDDPMMEAYLSGKMAIDPEELIRPMQAGRDGRVRIHVIHLENMSIYPDGQETALYDPALCFNWGLLDKMRRFPKEMAVFPNHVQADNGQMVCLNLGKAVVSEDGCIIGFIVIDVYRDTFLNAVRNVSDDEMAFCVADRSGVVLLDTTGRFEEGRKKEAEESLKGDILEQRTNAYGIRLNAYYNISDFYENSRLLLAVSVVVFIFTLMISFVLARLFANRMYRPISTLVDSMNDVTEGKLDIQIDIGENDTDEMKWVSSVFNWMINRIHILIEDAKEESERKKNAELKALQAQISPHFLYNMLNEIKALAKLGRTEDIAEFVIHLGKLLRRSINFQDDFVRLRDDLKFVDDYVRLQQIRYDQLFSVDISVDEEVMDCRIPNLIIQPLAENAIVHGFTAGKDHYILNIRGYRDGEKLCIEIYDNGIGVEKEYLKYINNVEKGVSIYGGLGVENVQKRLVLIYGMQYGLKMESEKGRYTKVIILMPFCTEE